MRKSQKFRGFSKITPPEKFINLLKIAPIDRSCFGLHENGLRLILSYFQRRVRSSQSRILGDQNAYIFYLDGDTYIYRRCQIPNAQYCYFSRFLFIEIVDFHENFRVYVFFYADSENATWRSHAATKSCLKLILCKITGHAVEGRFFEVLRIFCKLVSREIIYDCI